MAKLVSRFKQPSRTRPNGTQASKRRRSNVAAAANVAGYTKRLDAKEKKSANEDLDVYEYAPQKNKRGKVGLELDRDEEVAGVDEDDEEVDVAMRNVVGDAAGEVKSEDDEEIDSDEAFEGESDEERFAGFKFAEKKAATVAPKKPKRFAATQKPSKGSLIKTIDLDEDAPAHKDGGDSDEEGQSDEDDEEGASEFMDLSRMLEANGEDEGDEEDDSEDEESEEAEENDIDIDDDEEEDIEGKGSEDFEDEDEDEEGDLAKLETFVESLDSKKRKLEDTEEPIERKPKRRMLEERTETVPEGAFSAPTGPQLGLKKLGLEQLLAPLANNSSATDFLALKKATRALASASKNEALPAPLPYRAQEKLDRQAAYEQTKEEVEKWAPTMRRIREAEHLSFPLQAEPATRPSNSELAAKFKPTNEMESAVDRLLKEANMREQDITKTEDLAMTHLSVEEVAARRAELRQMRELMFRAEAKAKRIAKIKSKTYRKIHRKQREKNKAAVAQLEDSDPEAAQEERNALEVKRAKERATMRHKNTGKWAKAMLSRGELDVDQRKEISEQLQRGELLRKKILGVGDDSEEDDDDEAGDEVGERGIDDIKSGAFDELRRLEESAANEAAEDSTGKHQGLFQMKFMQDARSRDQQATNHLADDFKEELQKLGVDEGHPDDDNDDGADQPSFVTVGGNQGRRIFGAGGVQKPVAAETHASALQMADATTPPALAVEHPEPASASTAASANPWLTVPSASKVSRKKQSVVIGKDSSFVDKASNSLKQANAKSDVNRQLDKQDAVVEISMDEVLKVNKPESAVPRTKDKKTTRPTEATQAKDVQAVDLAYRDSDSEDEGPVTGMSAFTQRDLVAQAFAGDNVIEEFEEEKRREIEADAPKEEDITLPGWGSWGGKGVKPSNKKFVKHIPGVIPTQRADAGKTNVIISEKKDRKGAKYQVKDLPWPYTSKAQFERTVETPVGAEWNTRTMHQRMTMPRVVKKMGTIIDPVEKLF